VKSAAIAAILAVVAVPMTVQGMQAPTKAPAEKRYCEVNQPTGSRLGAVRRCRTKAEREQAKQEARTTVERIQAMKPTLCAPPNPC
jgi:hypothetical protein